MNNIAIDKPYVSEWQCLPDRQVDNLTTRHVPYLTRVSRPPAAAAAAARQRQSRLSIVTPTPTRRRHFDVTAIPQVWWRPSVGRATDQLTIYLAWPAPPSCRRRRSWRRSCYYNVPPPAMRIIMLAGLLHCIPITQFTCTVTFAVRLCRMLGCESHWYIMHKKLSRYWDRETREPLDAAEVLNSTFSVPIFSIIRNRRITKDYPLQYYKVNFMRFYNKCFTDAYIDMTCNFDVREP